jgi:hypothetical protein
LDLALIYATDAFINFSAPHVSDSSEGAEDIEETLLAYFPCEWCVTARSVWGISGSDSWTSKGETNRREREMWGVVFYRTCANQKKILTETELEAIKVICSPDFSTFTVLFAFS